MIRKNITLNNDRYNMMTNLNEKIKSSIFEVFDSLETNNFNVLGKPDEPMFESPLMGVAAGDDPYFDFLKEHIGEFHWSPSEAFAKKYGSSPEPSELRVISLVFPHTEETNEMQSKQIKFPCANWYISRGEWGNLMTEFCGKLENKLDDMGVRSVSIDSIKELAEQHSENLGIASNWSHRHAAFSAGMGTFGLSDGFITERGMSVRLTTVIVEADLDITPRGDIGPYDWCLYYRSGICGACIRRCPVRAISEKGHDKIKCSNYKDTVCAENWPEHIDHSNYKTPCGLCQTKIPCAYKRP